MEVVFVSGIGSWAEDGKASPLTSKQKVVRLRRLRGVMRIKVLPSSW